MSIDDPDFLRASHGTGELDIAFRDRRVQGGFHLHACDDFGDLVGPLVHGEMSSTGALRSAALRWQRRSPT